MSSRYQAGIVLPGYNALKVANAPTIGTATAASSTSVSVAFTAPACTGGGAISSYTAFACCGVKTNAGASSPIVVSGLTSGGAYTFKVVATNAYGPSYPSAASNSATTWAVPGTPTIGTATATGASTATVSYTAPASDGGTAITLYTATSSPGGITGTLATAGSGTITVSGLTPVTNYTFAVTATNAVGTGAASAASNSITTLAPYYMGILGISGRSSNLQGVAVNSSGDFYMSGALNVAGTSGVGEVVKYNSIGTIQFQKGYLGDATTFYGIAIASDGSYYAGGVVNQGPTGDDIVMVKFDSSGGLIWQKILAGTYSDIAYGVAVDSSDNVYAAGQSNSDTTFTRMTLDKWNSSGTLQYQREFRANGSTTYHYAQGVKVSGNNVYLAGFGSGFSRGQEAVLVNYNQSTNSMTWQQTLGLGSLSEAFYAVTLDSSGNVYAAGYGGDEQYGIVAKYDSSGNLQWQRKLGAGGATNYRAIAVDSSNNVYTVGDTSASGTLVLQIAKYNSSGTIQWQRKLSQTAYIYGSAIEILGNDMHIGGKSGATSGGQFLFMKLPTDGSKTGTYSVGGFSYTYAASTLTDADAGLINDTASYTIFTGALANQTPSFANSTTSAAQSVTQI